MARETETYRAELEQIIEYFNGKRILTVSDVSRYVGHSRAWVRNMGITADISATNLANRLSKMNG